MALVVGSEVDLWPKPIQSEWISDLWLETLLLLFSCQVMSNSLQPHEPQHISLLRPSLSSRVCSNSYPLSWWCHSIITSSVTPFFSCPQFFRASDLFQWVGSLNQVAKVLELPFQHQSFQWIFRVDFFYHLLILSPSVQGTLKESSLAPQFKSIHSSPLNLLYGPTLTSYMTTGNSGLTLTWSGPTSQQCPSLWLWAWFRDSYVTWASPIRSGAGNAGPQKLFIFFFFKILPCVDAKS